MLNLINAIIGRSSARGTVALLLVIGSAACEPGDAPVTAQSESAAFGSTPPGPTPTPGPVCRGPTVVENHPSALNTPLRVKSTTGPGLVAFASRTSAGSFRSGQLTLDAHTTAPGAAALRATANAANGVGVKAWTTSPNGLSLLVRSHSGAALLRAQRIGDNTPRFEIDNAAQVYTKGILVTEFGPDGDPGANGSNGSKGLRGSPGQPGRGVTFALCSDASSCSGRCLGGWIAIEADGPCEVGADFGACDRAGHDGVCCVCGT